MTKDNKGINHTSSGEHQSLVDAMIGFMDNGKPKVGIFWYDVANGSLFGVEKIDAEQAVFINGKGKISSGDLTRGSSTSSSIKMEHKTYWQKQHHRAEAKGDTSAIGSTTSTKSTSAKCWKMSSTCPTTSSWSLTITGTWDTAGPRRYYDF